MPLDGLCPKVKASTPSANLRRLLMNVITPVAPAAHDVLAPSEITNETQWRAYECEQWLQACQRRGLHMQSLPLCASARARLVSRYDRQGEVLLRMGSLRPLRVFGAQELA